MPYKEFHRLRQFTVTKLCSQKRAVRRLRRQKCLPRHRLPINSRPPHPRQAVTSISNSHPHRHLVKILVNRKAILVVACPHRQAVNQDACRVKADPWANPRAMKVVGTLVHRPLIRVVGLAHLAVKVGMVKVKAKTIKE